MVQDYTKSTWAALAGIRFLLAAIVLVGHLSWFVDLPQILVTVKSLGGIASVLGFLIISGISIGNSYSKQSDGYFKRRFFRIYPLYFFSICIPQLLIFVIGSPYTATKLDLVAAHWKTTVANLFLLQGFLSVPISSNLPVWSLSIEVFYYLLAPIFFKSTTRIILLLTALSMTAYYLRDNKHYLIFGYDSLCYAWPWLIGFTLSTKKYLKLPIAFLFVGIIIVVNKSGNENTDTYSWLNFGLVSLLVLSIINSKFYLTKLSQKIFNFLGELSFPLYLFHVPLLLFWFHFFNIKNPWILMVLACASVIPLSYALDYWLKNNFWKPLINLLVSKLRKNSFLPVAAADNSDSKVVQNNIHG